VTLTNLWLFSSTMNHINSTKINYFEECDGSVPINIPLHGPRVEVILVSLGVVYLPELKI